MLAQLAGIYAIDLHDLGSSPRSTQFHIVFQLEFTCSVHSDVHHVPSSSNLHASREHQIHGQDEECTIHQVNTLAHDPEKSMIHNANGPKSPGLHLQIWDHTPLVCFIIFIFILSLIFSFISFTCYLFN